MNSIEAIERIMIGTINGRIRSGIPLFMQLDNVSERIKEIAKEVTSEELSSVRPDYAIRHLIARFNDSSFGI